jgi:hypothetical protein
MEGKTDKCKTLPEVLPPTTHLGAHEFRQRQPRLLPPAQYLDLLVHGGAAKHHASQQLLEVIELGIR